MAIYRLFILLCEMPFILVQSPLPLPRLFLIPVNFFRPLHLTGHPQIMLNIVIGELADISDTVRHSVQLCQKWWMPWKQIGHWIMRIYVYMGCSKITIRIIHTRKLPTRTIPRGQFPPRPPMTTYMSTHWLLCWHICWHVQVPTYMPTQQDADIHANT